MGTSAVEKKTVTVLFTRYHRTVANLIYLFSGRGFTHASIALDEENQYFYSFNGKGFRKEYPRKHKGISDKSISMRLELPQEGFEKIKDKISEFEQGDFEYSRLGVFFCLLRIPHKRRKKYFCSQFVAEVLQLSGEVQLKHHSSLYTPNILLSELQGQNCLKKIISPAI